MQHDKGANDNEDASIEPKSIDTLNDLTSKSELETTAMLRIIPEREIPLDHSP